jgi:hypothetical protein
LTSPSAAFVFPLPRVPALRVCPAGGRLLCFDLPFGAPFFLQTMRYEERDKAF